MLVVLKADNTARMALFAWKFHRIRQIFRCAENGATFGAALNIKTVERIKSGQRIENKICWSLFNPLAKQLYFKLPDTRQSLVPRCRVHPYLV